MWHHVFDSTDIWYHMVTTLPYGVMWHHMVAIHSCGVMWHHIMVMQYGMVSCGTTCHTHHHMVPYGTTWCHMSSHSSSHGATWHHIKLYASPFSSMAPYDTIWCYMMLWLATSHNSQNYLHHCKSLLNQFKQTHTCVRNTSIIFITLHKRHVL